MSSDTVHREDTPVLHETSGSIIVYRSVWLVLEASGSISNGIVNAVEITSEFFQPLIYTVNVSGALCVAFPLPTPLAAKVVARPLASHFV